MSVLAGRRIVVTRAAATADPLVDDLAALGAVPIRFPAIETKPPESIAALDDALRTAGRYDWIVFTSATGVEAAVGRAREIGLPGAWHGDARVAAVGPATARALRAYGIGAAAVPDEFMAGGIPDAIGDIAGRRFLLARADRAHDDLPRRLREGGGVVDDVVAYRTVPLSGPVTGPAAEAVRAGVDAVTFTSPSTVEGFVNGMGAGWRPAVGRAIVATIGPRTSRAARAAGMRVAAQAEPHTIGGLIDALTAAFDERAAEHIQ